MWFGSAQYLLHRPILQQLNEQLPLYVLIKALQTLYVTPKKSKCSFEYIEKRPTSKLFAEQVSEANMGLFGGNKSKSGANKEFTIKMPSGGDPKFEEEFKATKGLRKAYVVLVQQEQAGSWHAIKVLKKPAVNGLVFFWEERLFVLDTRRVWYYDEKSNPVLLYDITVSLPNLRPMTKKEYDDMQEKIKNRTQNTLDSLASENPDVEILNVVEPTQPLEPQTGIKIDDNIDSAFSYTMIYRKLLEQLTRASTPEQKQTFDLMTILLIVVALVAGISVGYTLGAHYATPIIQGSTTTITVTQTGSVTGIQTSTAIGGITSTTVVGGA